MSSYLLFQFLLVQSYWSKSSWSFPKGKVNEEEKGHDCAVREVFEETGFDIGPFINPKDYMEAVVNDQTIRLYPIPGVPTDTIFKPRLATPIHLIPSKGIKNCCIVISGPNVKFVMSSGFQSRVCLCPKKESCQKIISR